MRRREREFLCRGRERERETREERRDTQREKDEKKRKGREGEKKEIQICPKRSFLSLLLFLLFSF